MAEEGTLETVGEPQRSESEETTSTQQPVSLETAGEPQESESEEATSTQQPVSSSEPEQPESESTSQQPKSFEKDNEPQQPESEKVTSTQQPVSLEKVSEPQKPEPEEATSMATSTQQSKSSEKVSEPKQAGSEKEADSQNASEGGWVTAYTYKPTNVRIPPEVDDCQFCRIVVELTTAYVVYKDDDFVCFSDRSPVSTCHYLLVPRKHLRDLRLVVFIESLFRKRKMLKCIEYKYHIVGNFSEH